MPGDSNIVENQFWRAVRIRRIADLLGDDQLRRELDEIAAELEMDAARQQDLMASRDRLEQLSVRQLQVVRHMTAGLSNKQIAAELGIDEKTVKMHRAAARSRLGVRSSASAIRIAVEAGLVDNI